MISTKWKAVEAMVIVLALSVVFLACQNAPASPPTEVPAPPSSTSSPEPTATSALAPTLSPEPTATSTLAPTPSPEPTQDQSTRTNPIDGAIYVRVPAGPFLMGSSDNDPLARDDEKRQHPVTLDEFWIKQTEVTNGEYARCVQAGACTEPHTAIWADPEYGNHPVVNVTWYQANDYVDWAGGRLCTEAEWEKACRGTEGQIYPWGDAFDGSSLNYCDSNCEMSGKDETANDGYGTTAPAGSYPDGASPYGVLDLAGNGFEWTSSLYEAYPYNPADGREDLQTPVDVPRVFRGGAFRSFEDFVRCASRVRSRPDYAFDVCGFRVCASP